MKPLLWAIVAVLPLGAQPKLLVNAKLDTRSAAAGLEQAFRPLVTAQPQPAWIAYSVATTRVNLGCDYVRDGWSQPGVIHRYGRPGLRSEESTPSLGKAQGLAGVDLPAETLRR